ncbi:MAG: MFS transporter [Calothrix sp. SM1_5_4]|nr:MFS transporter [Calothrix sp. SM1_5_4]
MNLLTRSQFFYLASIFTTNVGNSISFLAAGKLIYDQVGAAAVFAAIIGMEHIQSTLLSFSSGVLVDRWGAKRVAVISDILFALISFAMAAGLYLGNMPLLIPLGMLLSNFLKPFYRSSTFALLKRICGDNDTFRINSQSALLQQMGYFSGLAIAGLFMSSSNIPQLLLFDGITFVASAACLAFVRANGPTVPERTAVGTGRLRRFIDDHLAIVPFVRANPVAVRLLIIIVIQLLVIDAFNISLFKLAQVRYPDKSSALAMIDGSYAVGVMLMAALQSRLNRLRIQPSSLSLVLLVEAALFLCIGLSHALWLTVALTVLFSATISSVFTHTFSELYRVIPSEIAGRIGGLRGLMLGVTGIVFTLASGLAIDLGGVLGGYVTGSCLLIVAAWLPLRSAWLNARTASSSPENE